MRAMKKAICLVIVGLFICTFFTQNISSEINHKGSTLVVPDDYQTIQEAIDSANNGDTVFILQDTYYESVKIDKKINLIGENKNTTIINGTGNEQCIYLDYHSIKISGLTLKNNYKKLIHASYYCNEMEIFDCNFYGGINIYKSNSINIHHNYFEFFNRPLFVINCNNCLISENEFNSHDCRYSIAIENPSFSNIIENNRINGSITGIDIDNAAKENTIKNNEITNANTGLVVVESNNTILNNKISNCNIGIFLWGNSNLVSNNSIIKNDEYGIEIIDGKYNIISNNIIDSNKKDGINMNGYKNEILDNTIKNNSRIGVFLKSSSGNNSIYGNNILFNDYGLFFTKSEDNDILYNNIYDNYALNAYFKYCTNYWDGNYWGKTMNHLKFILGKNFWSNIEVPWLNFDMNPAKEPYNIELW